MKLKIIASLILVLATTFFQTTSSFACSCVARPSVEKSVEKSTAVFAGKVIGTDNSSSSLWVSLSWKGTREEFVTVSSSMGNCSFQFKKGEEYLIYAYGVKQLKTSVCTRTKKLSDAKEDLAQLGKPLVANRPETAQPNQDDITQIMVEQLVGAGMMNLNSPVVLWPEKNNGYVNSDFYRLSQWLEYKKFFELKNLYRDKNLGTDGGSTKISVVRKGISKTVEIQEENRELWEIEMVIRGVAADITAQKERDKK